MIGNIPFIVSDALFENILENSPAVVYGFTIGGKNVVAVWYGGDSHMGHWFTASGKCIAVVTRYNDNAPEPNLYTSENWLAFFVAHERDFYDNWAADEWN